LNSFRYGWEKKNKLLTSIVKKDQAVEKKGKIIVEAESNAPVQMDNGKEIKPSA
jgi:hypothetical protein